MSTRCSLIVGFTSYVLDVLIRHGVIDWLDHLNIYFYFPFERKSILQHVFNQLLKFDSLDYRISAFIRFQNGSRWSLASDRPSDRCRDLQTTTSLLFTQPEVS